MHTSEVFQTRLPRRPYCSNDLSYGLAIRPAALALEHKHIQPNPPSAAGWLIFDLDYPDAAEAWRAAGLPPPTLTISNPENGHAHLLYGLTAPVCTSDAGRAAPIRYAAAVESAFRLRLRADPGYAGLISKNPFHPAWSAIWVNRLYDLGELAKYVDLKNRQAPQEALGLGRNCTLFDELRDWAYKWVREYQRADASFDLWYRAVAGGGERLNGFSVPLSANEVKGISKSVARWTWRNFSEAAFSELQSQRGKRGGRPATTTREGEPWVLMEISRATYYRRVKNGLVLPVVETKAISDISSTGRREGAASHPSPTGAAFLKAGRGGAASTQAKEPGRAGQSGGPGFGRPPKSKQNGRPESADTSEAEDKAWIWFDYTCPGTRNLWAREWEHRKVDNPICPKRLMPWHYPPFMLSEPDVQTSAGPVPFIEMSMRRIEANLRALGRPLPWAVAVWPISARRP